MNSNRLDSEQDQTITPEQDVGTLPSTALCTPKALAPIQHTRSNWLQQLAGFNAALHAPLSIALTLSDFLFETAQASTNLFIKEILSWDYQQPFQVETHHPWLSYCQSAETEPELHTRLRQWRKVWQWRFIIRDALGLASLEETYLATTTLACQQVSTALHWIEHQQQQKWGTPTLASGERMTLVVLGLGKLGARELNLSSDLDLIFAFAEGGTLSKDKTTKHGEKKGLSHQEYFERLGQKLIQALDKNIAGEQVFRVDMRLRPYGQSGPLVMSFQAMEIYYRDQGRSWERFAMTRVIQVAGSKTQGNNLLSMLRAFAYRRYLDYSIIDSLRSMKRQIEAEGRSTETETNSFNLKLGRGGIREAEFIAQALQLIRGGQDPRLQDAQYQPLMQLIATEGLLPPTACLQLINAYNGFRRTEHALQAIHDQQTQSIPQNPLDQARLAWYLGFNDWHACLSVLKGYQNQVNKHFKAFINPPTDNQDAQQITPWVTLWQSTEKPIAHALSTSLDQLKRSHAVMHMQSRSRERLDLFMPNLLNKLGARGDEHTQVFLFNRIKPLLEAIARRSVYLVLLMENPSAISLLLDLTQASPWVSATLTQHPILLDELLDPGYLYETPDRHGLVSELNQRLLRVQLDDLGRSMEVLRHFVQIHQFHAAASEVMQKLSLMKVSDYLTWLAEVVLERSLDLAWQQLIVKYGAPSDDSGQPSTRADFLILGYGKLAGLEMNYASDLDLVFIHEAKAGTTTGERNIDNSLFYTRLAQRIVHMLTTATEAGSAYHIDLRLRPSGASGMIVTSFKGFAAYHQQQAWTWEHQALVRARPITGCLQLAKKIESVRISQLTKIRELKKLRTEIIDMRTKMRAQQTSLTPDQFDLKQSPGGLIDIEFIVQFFALAWSHQYPDALLYTDNMRLLDAYQAAKWLTAMETEALQNAYLYYRALIHEQALQNMPSTITLDDSKETLNQYRNEVETIWYRYIETTD